MPHKKQKQNGEGGRDVERGETEIQKVCSSAFQSHISFSLNFFPNPVSHLVENKSNPDVKLTDKL